MNFDLFDKMSREEANEYLNAFISIEGKHVNTLIDQAQSDGVVCDYSLSSIEPFGIWCLTKIKTFPKEEDGSLPEWLRASACYKSGLFDFDEPSKIIIMRFSYYLGETFVRCCKKLAWSLGSKQTAVKNMPVVKGFKNKMELAPIMVSENLFSALVADPEREVGFQKSVEAWKSYVH